MPNINSDNNNILNSAYRNKRKVKGNPPPPAPASVQKRERRSKTSQTKKAEQQKIVSVDSNVAKANGLIHNGPGCPPPSAPASVQKRERRSKTSQTKKAEQQKIVSVDSNVAKDIALLQAENAGNVALKLARELDEGALLDGEKALYYISEFSKNINADNAKYIVIAFTKILNKVYGGKKLEGDTRETALALITKFKGNITKDNAGYVAVALGWGIYNNLDSESAKDLLREFKGNITKDNAGSVAHALRDAIYEYKDLDSNLVKDLLQDFQGKIYTNNANEVAHMLAKALKNDEIKNNSKYIVKTLYHECKEKLGDDNLYIQYIEGKYLNGIDNYEDYFDELEQLEPGNPNIKKLKRAMSYNINGRQGYYINKYNAKAVAENFVTVLYKYEGKGLDSNMVNDLFYGLKSNIDQGNVEPVAYALGYAFSKGYDLDKNLVIELLQELELKKEDSADNKVNGVAYAFAGALFKGYKLSNELVTKFFSSVQGKINENTINKIAEAFAFALKNGYDLNRENVNKLLSEMVDKINNKNVINVAFAIGNAITEGYELEPDEVNGLLKAFSKDNIIDKNNAGYVADALGNAIAKGYELDANVVEGLLKAFKGKINEKNAGDVATVLAWVFWRDKINFKDKDSLLNELCEECKKFVTDNKNLEYIESRKLASVKSSSSMSSEGVEEQPVSVNEPVQPTLKEDVSVKQVENEENQSGDTPAILSATIVPGSSNAPDETQEQLLVEMNEENNSSKNNNNENSDVSSAYNFEQDFEDTSYGDSVLGTKEDSILNKAGYSDGETESIQQPFENEDNQPEDTPAILSATIVPGSSNAPDETQEQLLDEEEDDTSLISDTDSSDVNTDYNQDTTLLSPEQTAINEYFNEYFGKINDSLPNDLKKLKEAMQEDREGHSTPIHIGQDNISNVIQKFSGLNQSINEETRKLYVNRDFVINMLKACNIYYIKSSNMFSNKVIKILYSQVNEYKSIIQEDFALVSELVEKYRNDDNKLQCEYIQDYINSPQLVKEVENQSGDTPAILGATIVPGSSNAPDETQEQLSVANNEIKDDTSLKNYTDYNQKPDELTDEQWDLHQFIDSYYDYSSQQFPSYVACVQQFCSHGDYYYIDKKDEVSDIVAELAKLKNTGDSKQHTFVMKMLEACDRYIASSQMHISPKLSNNFKAVLLNELSANMITESDCDLLDNLMEKYSNGSDEGKDVEEQPEISVNEPVQPTSKEDVNVEQVENVENQSGDTPAILSATIVPGSSNAPDEPQEQPQLPSEKSYESILDNIKADAKSSDLLNAITKVQNAMTLNNSQQAQITADNLDTVARYMLSAMMYAKRESKAIPLELIDKILQDSLSCIKDTRNIAELSFMLGNAIGVGYKPNANLVNGLLEAFAEKITQNNASGVALVLQNAIITEGYRPSEAVVENILQAFKGNITKTNAGSVAKAFVNALIASYTFKDTNLVENILLEFSETEIYKNNIANIADVFGYVLLKGYTFNNKDIVINLLTKFNDFIQNNDVDNQIAEPVINGLGQVLAKGYQPNIDLVKNLYNKIKEVKNIEHDNRNLIFVGEYLSKYEEYKNNLSNALSGYDVKSAEKVQVLIDKLYDLISNYPNVNLKEEYGQESEYFAFALFHNMEAQNIESEKANKIIKKLVDDDLMNFANKVAIMLLAPTDKLKIDKDIADEFWTEIQAQAENNIDLLFSGLQSACKLEPSKIDPDIMCKMIKLLTGFMDKVISDEGYSSLLVTILIQYSHIEGYTDEDTNNILKNILQQVKKNGVCRNQDGIVKFLEQFEHIIHYYNYVDYKKPTQSMMNVIFDFIYSIKDAKVFSDDINTGSFCNADLNSLRNSIYSLIITYENSNYSKDSESYNNLLIWLASFKDIARGEDEEDIITEFRSQLESKYDAEEIGEDTVTSLESKLGLSKKKEPIMEELHDEGKDVEEQPVSVNEPVQPTLEEDGSVEQVENVENQSGDTPAILSATVPSSANAPDEIQEQLSVEMNEEKDDTSLTHQIIDEEVITHSNEPEGCNFDRITPSTLYQLELYDDDIVKNMLELITDLTIDIPIDNVITKCGNSDKTLPVFPDNLRHIVEIKDSFTDSYKTDLPQLSNHIGSECYIDQNNIGNVLEELNTAVTNRNITYEDKKLVIDVLAAFEVLLEYLDKDTIEKGLNLVRSLINNNIIEQNSILVRIIVQQCDNLFSSNKKLLDDLEDIHKFLTNCVQKKGAVDFANKSLAYLSQNGIRLKNIELLQQIKDKISAKSLEQAFGKDGELVDTEGNQIIVSQLVKDKGEETLKRLLENYYIDIDSMSYDVEKSLERKTGKLSIFTKKITYKKIGENELNVKCKAKGKTKEYNVTYNKDGSVTIADPSTETDSKSSDSSTTYEEEGFTSIIDEWSDDESIGYATIVGAANAESEGAQSQISEPSENEDKDVEEQSLSVNEPVQSTLEEDGSVEQFEEIQQVTVEEQPKISVETPAKPTLKEFRAKLDKLFISKKDNKDTLVSPRKKEDILKGINILYNLISNYQDFDLKKLYGKNGELFSTILVNIIRQQNIDSEMANKIIKKLVKDELMPLKNKVAIVLMAPTEKLEIEKNTVEEFLSDIKSQRLELELEIKLIQVQILKQELAKKQELIQEQELEQIQTLTLEQIETKIQEQKLAKRQEQQMQQVQQIETKIQRLELVKKQKLIQELEQELEQIQTQIPKEKIEQIQKQIAEEKELDKKLSTKKEEMKSYIQDFIVGLESASKKGSSRLNAKILCETIGLLPNFLKFIEHDKSYSKQIVNSLIAYSHIEGYTDEAINKIFQIFKKYDVIESDKKIASFIKAFANKMEIDKDKKDSPEMPTQSMMNVIFNYIYSFKDNKELYSDDMMDFRRSVLELIIAYENYGKYDTNSTSYQNIIKLFSPEKEVGAGITIEDEKSKIKKELSNNDNNNEGQGNVPTNQPFLGQVTQMPFAPNGPFIPNTSYLNVQLAQSQGNVPTNRPAGRQVPYNPLYINAQVQGNMPTNQQSRQESGIQLPPPIPSSPQSGMPAQSGSSLEPPAIPSAQGQGNTPTNQPSWGLPQYNFTYLNGQLAQSQGNVPTNQQSRQESGIQLPPPIPSLQSGMPAQSGSSLEPPAIPSVQGQGGVPTNRPPVQSGSSASQSTNLYNHIMEMCENGDLLGAIANIDANISQAGSTIDNDLLSSLTYLVGFVNKLPKDSTIIDYQLQISLENLLETIVNRNTIEADSTSRSNFEGAINAVTFIDRAKIDALLKSIKYTSRSRFSFNKWLGRIVNHTK